MITWTARSMVFWRDGVPLSKAAALQREIDAGGPFREAYELALAVRQGGPGVAEQHAVALREQFDRLGQPAAALLRQMARDGAVA